LIGCSGADRASHDETTTASEPILICPPGEEKVCNPGEGPHGTTICGCEPIPQDGCESDLISSWQQSMPSLGYASSEAAQAIDQAVLGLVNIPEYNHPQFVGGMWPGLTVAITQGTRLVFAKSYGFAEMQGPQLTQPDDLFRLASDSKQITGATILKLIANGQSVDGTPNNPLTLDSLVFPILSSPPNAILPPGGLAAISPALQNITVREVLQHTGGWAYNIGDPTTYVSVPGAILPVTETNVVEYMEQQAPSLSPPGATFSYSNFGYNLLATLITKITGQDYETVVQEQVLAPLGITRTQVGHSLYSIDGEVQYYTAYNSPSAATMFPGQTANPISGDQNLPYGTWSLEAGRGAGGWIASSVDILRFQLGVNGRGNLQVYPNIFSDIMSTVGQPSQSFNEGTGTYSPVDPSLNRYMAGWGINYAYSPFDGLRLSHGGGVNGGGSYTESNPDAPGIVGYGMALVINTTPTAPANPDFPDTLRSAMLNVLSSNSDSLLDPTWSADTDFFDQYGAFSVYRDAGATKNAIAAAANGCTYNGLFYPVCYASRLEGQEGETPQYRVQIVPLHSGDAATYLLGVTCTQYVAAQQNLSSNGYQQVNLQWFKDGGTRRFQSVWVKIRH
jgi:CubicO group peptidase (beta-lactamase class C family)